MNGPVLYAGCYTHESPVGVRVYDASDPDGHLVERGEVTGIEQASFLAVHPNGRVLYAVSETTSFDGGEGGGLVAFRIDPDDGSLTQFDRAPSRGAAPCYVSVSADGRHVHVANYLSGTIAVYAASADGGFGELVACREHRGSGPTSRQEGPHPHCVLPGPGGEWVYAADLGTDRVVRYRRDRGPGREAFEACEDHAFDAGAGPRHLAFHPGFAVAFVVCELLSTLVVLGVDPTTGALSEIGRRCTLPDDFVGDSIAAEVRVHPRGHRVYVSNRGHDSIAVFGFTDPSAPLELLGHVATGGRTPRNFAIHPAGRSLLVANQDSDTIVAFGIDPDSGLPRELGITYDISEPVCLTFADVGR